MARRFRVGDLVEWRRKTIALSVAEHRDGEWRYARSHENTVIRHGARGTIVQLYARNSGMVVYIFEHRTHYMISWWDRPNWRRVVTDKETASGEV
jgi:hypothetical protein